MKRIIVSGSWGRENPLWWVCEVCWHNGQTSPTWHWETCSRRQPSNGSNPGGLSCGRNILPTEEPLEETNDEQEAALPKQHQCARSRFRRNEGKKGFFQFTVQGSILSGAFDPRPHVQISHGGSNGQVCN